MLGACDGQTSPYDFHDAYSRKTAAYAHSNNGGLEDVESTASSALMLAELQAISANTQMVGCIFAPPYNKSWRGRDVWRMECWSEFLTHRPTIINGNKSHCSVTHKTNAQRNIAKPKIKPEAQARIPSFSLVLRNHGCQFSKRRGAHPRPMDRD